MGYTTYTTPDPVLLDGFQAITKPGQYGYSMEAIIGQDMVDKLEMDRVESLKWSESKLKNPRRKSVRPEPWEEVSEGGYKVKFRWKEDQQIPIVDSEGEPVTDPNTPLYSGSKVRIAFYQKPYILQDGTTIGTSLKPISIQIVSLSSKAGVDSGGGVDLDHEKAAALFGKTAGYKASEPNVVRPVENDAAIDEDDF